MVFLRFLPAVEMTKYLDRIEQVIGIPIKFIGTGPEREDFIKC